DAELILGPPALTEGTGVRPWYELSRLETLSKLLLQQDRFAESIEVAKGAIRLATSSGAAPFMPRLLLLQAEAQLDAGEAPSSVSVPLEVFSTEHSLIQAADISRVVGRSLFLSGHEDRGRWQVERAVRTLGSVGALSEEARAIASLNRCGGSVD